MPKGKNSHYKKKSDQPVKNKDFNKKVSTALVKLAESKHLDTVFAPAGGTTGVATITSIFDPPQNVTDTGRVGDFVRLKSIGIKYWIKTNIASVNTVLMRVMIVQWYDQTSPVIANILQQTTTPFTSMYSYDRIRDDNNMRVLYDKIHTMDRSGPANAATEAFPHVQKYLKYFKKKTYFNSGTNPPTNGGLYLVYFSNSTLAGDSPFFELTSRVTYTDY